MLSSLSFFHLDCVMNRRVESARLKDCESQEARKSTQAWVRPVPICVIHRGGNEYSTVMNCGECISTSRNASGMHLTQQPTVTSNAR